MCGLNCWEGLGCCKYDENKIIVGKTEYTHSEWQTCLDGNEVWCVVDDNEYITGFRRGSGNQLMYLEEAKTRKIYRRVESGLFFFIYCL